MLCCIRLLTTFFRDCFTAFHNPPRPRLRGVKGRFASSGSSSEDEDAAAGPALSVSPPSLLSLPSFKNVGNEKGGEKEVWVSVFRHLTRAQLLTCMSVCKAWYKWCVSSPAPHARHIF